MKLEEWATIYFKHQDMLKKEILSFTPTENGFVIEKKSGKEALLKENWVVRESLQFQEAPVQGYVCLNTQENVRILASSWKAVKDSEMKIIFANPKTNEKWILVPGHHNRVADEKTIKEGLLSLASAITLV